MTVAGEMKNFDVIANTVGFDGDWYGATYPDAAALGLEAEAIEFEAHDDGVVREDQVKQALKTIFDPEIPINLLDLGLIYGIDIDGGQVNIRMTLTAPTCGMGPVLISDVKYRVAKVPNVEKVDVELVFDPPWSRDMMTEEAQLEAGLFF